MQKSVRSTKSERDESTQDSVLHPKRLAEYIGQDKVKQNLRIQIDAAMSRGETIDHTLLYGPYGIGKDALAQVISYEMGVSFKVISGLAIERVGNLAAILTNIRTGDVLFVDEVHRLGHAVEEALYQAMGDFTLDIIIGKGPSARSLRLNLPHFTLIGATTRFDMLPAPLRDSFGAIYRLDFYDESSMQEIVKRSANLLEVPIEHDAVVEIARRSRGTPRIANRLLRRVRDFAQVRAEGTITASVSQQALAMLEVDALGLDETDRKVLRAIIQRFDGGPVGLDTVAASIREKSDIIMEICEPYLIHIGFLDRTSRGRLATRGAYKHLDLPYPEHPEHPEHDQLL